MDFNRSRRRVCVYAAAAMTHGFDRLWVRLLIAQVAVLALAFVAMVLTVGQQRGSAVARFVAPMWAQSIEAQYGTQPAAMYATPATVRAASPPPEARAMRALRYRVLRQELDALGIQVGDIRVQLNDTGETTWVEVLNRSPSERWVGFAGGIFALDEPTRQPLLLAIVATLIVGASALLTWMLVRPLARLRRAIADFRASGKLPDTISESIGGPREIRLLAESFAAMASSKAALDRDRALMLAGISHDLRSPLARIRLTADLLHDSTPEIEAARAAIKKNVDLADRHLAMFLAFSQPLVEVETQTLEVETIWRQAVALSLPDERAVQLSIAPEARRFRANERVLTRILSMGIENAHKHGTAPIYGRTFVRADQFIFEIEDCGTALPASERARVMRAFERGESSRTTPGTGLGLALASQLAERIDGSVELDAGQHGFVFRLIVKAR
jgi:two-component system osmolarity sensor histidine kinase EnvZ